MGLLNETVLLKTKSTLFNLLIKETSQFQSFERLLNMTYEAYKNGLFREMQFWSHCHTVVSYQALFRLSVYKIPAVYLSGAKMCVFARYATLVPRLVKINKITYWEISSFGDLKFTALLSGLLKKLYLNKKVTSDFHGTVSINPGKMSQQK